MQLAGVLDNLFEPCAALRGCLTPQIRKTQFPTYTALIAFCRVQLLSLIGEYVSNPTPEKRELICKVVSAHPRLGVPKKQTGSLSAHSQNEQKSLATQDGEDSSLAKLLQELNAKYETTFPGLIFVVFVNGRSRSEIMDIMNDRIKNSTWNNEVRIAFDAMCDIALDRAQKLNAKL